MKIKLDMAGKPSIEIECRKFSHYIKNCRFWFAYHKSIDSHGLTVSHFASGKKITDIGYSELSACLNDEKSAAKMAIDKLVARAGADKVYTVLCQAEK